MARRYLTRCTVSLAVLVVTVLLQVSPAAAFAGMGAVGDALTSGANGYLEALNKAPDERIARERAQLEIRLLELETQRLKLETQRLESQLAQRCRVHTDTINGQRIACEICCYRNGDCETTCR